MSVRPTSSGTDMTCMEAREAVSVALDGELAGGDLARLECHLDACPACAAYADDLAALTRSLPAQLSDEADTEALWHRVQTIIDAGEEAVEARQARQAVPRRRLVRMGLAASVLLSAGGAGLYALTAPQAPDVVAEAVNDYLTFRASGRKLHILDARREAVAEWLEARVDFDVSLRSSAPLALPLVGGRLCSFAGRRLVFLHFADQDREASLYVMRDDGLDLTAPRRQRVDGREILTRSERGVASAAWRRAGLIHVVVAEMPETTLARLAGQI